MKRLAIPVQMVVYVENSQSLKDEEETRQFVEAAFQQVVDNSTEWYRKNSDMVQQEDGTWLHPENAPYINVLEYEIKPKDEWKEEVAVKSA